MFSRLSFLGYISEATGQAATCLLLNADPAGRYDVAWYHTGPYGHSAPVSAEAPLLKLLRWTSFSGGRKNCPFVTLAGDFGASVCSWPVREARWPLVTT
jgi:hypothetical protein